MSIQSRGVASTDIVAPGFNPATESKNVNECRRHGTYYSPVLTRRHKKKRNKVNRRPGTFYMGRAYGTYYLFCEREPRVETRGYK
ncbi:hypothetical protein [Mucilaginibacter sp. UYCu711]|uniref:hypothetical protein n=1 Tax=Mucilaginibacter sp. UYCu711 TaxID=3156339 RepID=UPI003D246B96